MIFVHTYLSAHYHAIHCIRGQIGYSDNSWSGLSGGKFGGTLGRSASTKSEFDSSPLFQFRDITLLNCVRRPSKDPHSSRLGKWKGSQ